MNEPCLPGSSHQHFELVDPPRLARSVVDRVESLRSDTARLAEGWPKAKVVVVDEGGRTPMRLGAGGEWEVLPKTATDIGATPPDEAVLLGEHDGVAYWTVRGSPSLIDGDDPSQWYDLRTRGGDLDAISAGLVTTAVAVLGWHEIAAFCANCGTATARRHSGWMRHCPNCEREEYPRTDPAVICLVHDGGSGGSARVLLARQPVWPPGRYSVLAGFVEAGESLEACVVREIEEEVGLVVSDIRYLSSQAWPFPRSLMIGFSAVSDASLPLHPADGEIAEAFWVTRDELRASAGSAVGWEAATGPGAQLLLPPPVSIARSMLDAWLAAD
ncbi:MAG: NAD(+) diphosphatase [Pseudonocardia sp.]